MSYEHLSNKTVKTRKLHHCIWCPEPIEAGEPAHYVVGKFDGDFSASYYHTECYKASQDFFSESDCGEWFSAHEFKRGTIDPR